MEVTLPVQLKRFVEKKVKDGFYTSENELVCDALRGLRDRESLLRGVLTASPHDSVLPNLGGGAGDIEAMAFIVLMQAVKDMDEDLKSIMDKIKAMNTAKKRLREIMGKVNRDVAANSGQQDGKPPLDLRSGLGSQKAYHHAQLPFVDPGSPGGVKPIPTDLFPGSIECLAHLEAVRDDLQGRLDGMGELSELTSLRLQILMDRRSKIITTLSNIMKKISTTQDALVQNLK